MSFFKFLFFLTIILTIFGCTNNYTDPKIKILNDSIHFENSKVGDTITIWIKYANIGEKDLKIEAVETSCGCTVPFFSENILKPNSHDSIKILFTPAYKGVNEQTVVIKSNSISTFDVVKITCDTHD